MGYNDDFVLYKKEFKMINCDLVNSDAETRDTIIRFSFANYYIVVPSEHYLRDWWSSQGNINKTSSAESNLTIPKMRCDYV